MVSKNQTDSPTVVLTTRSEVGIKIDRATIQQHLIELEQLLVQLTYRATMQHSQDDRLIYSVRSSVWRFEGEEWQIIFHQGATCEPLTAQILEY